MLELIDKERRTLFLGTLHSLWIERNKLVFQEFEVPSDLQRRPPPQRLPDWRLMTLRKKLELRIVESTIDYFKFNVDAATNLERVGVGVVVRDNEGVVMVAAMLEALYPLSVKEAEAIALFLDVVNAAQNCFLSIKIEGDNVEVIMALNSSQAYSDHFGTIIANCKTRPFA
ncbi:hypothetical protein PIB30_060938 [Stylosanthes scabra]|uniref:RNase H type-1 domain-containing protein n=1 Tax=Stylosanthes scabra TaxID=79078 RepID=A0ABU6UK56_9FABA|nr:hypothetical protein [Stylosanthes scabra]